MKRRTADSARPEVPTGPADWAALGGPPVPGADASVAEPEDSDLHEPMPDAERLVADAVRLAGDDLDTARLVGRYWRFAPDEELVGLTPGEMVADAPAHPELAGQRVPGGLRLRISASGKRWPPACEL